MNLFFLFLLHLPFESVFLESHKIPYHERYFDQYIDHFNYVSQPENKETFQQRYLVSDKYWNGKGPILFYCGNEGDIVNFWDNTGFMFALAPKFNALVLFGEHRYYGKSLPFGEKSFDLKNIGYLNIEQTLADYAVLLKHVQKDYNAGQAPVIAMGGSYGGLLAGYMRYKYPHIIFAAVASSAPFLTVAGHSPRHEFFQAVTNTFHMAKPSCPASVQQGFAQLKEMLKKKKYSRINEVFNLCSGQEKKSYFHEHLLSWLRNAFVLLAMVDYPYPANFMAKLPGYPVNKACSFMAGDDKLAGLANITNLLYGGGDKGKCHDTYAEYVYCADPTGCGTGPDSIAWDYQACTEMILPGGSNNRTDMFPRLPFTIDMRTHYCQGKFGLGYSRTDWLGTNFFASLQDIKRSSRIIFPNGNLDPWMPGGVLKDLSDSLIAILIEGGAHHLDLRAANEKDPKSVIEAREKIETYLKKWMKNEGYDY